MKRIRRTPVAVIGVGNIGWHHARVYHTLPDAKLVGIVDANPKRAAKAARAFRCPTFPDIRSLVAAAKPRAVSVAVPTNLHRTVGGEILRFGCNLLVEKPVAGTIADAQTLIRLARRQNLVLAVGHIERFNPAIRKLKELYDRGTLGKAITILARRVGLFPPSFGGANVILDLAIHDLDLLHFFLNEPVERVMADAGRVYARGRDDHAEILVKTRTATALIKVNWITPVKIRTFSLTGTKGHAEVDLLNQTLRVARPTVGREFRTYREFLAKFGAMELVDVPVKRAEPLAEELHDFLTAVRERRRPTVTGEDGLWALDVARRVIVAAAESG